MTNSQRVFDDALSILACDLRAIPLQDRTRYSHLQQRLTDSVDSAKELQVGYVFEFRSGSISANELSNWMDLERMCCPWLSLEMRQIKRNRIAIHMRYPEYAKNVVRAAFSSWLKLPKAVEEDIE